MKIPTELLVHSVTVRPLLGESSIGKVYGEPFTLPCFADGKRRLVRGATGDQLLSTLTLLADPGQADRVPPGSEVTWQSDTTVVIASANRDSGGLGAPDHTEVACE